MSQMRQMGERIRLIADTWIGEDVPQTHVASAFQISVYKNGHYFHYSDGVENASGKRCTAESVFDIASVTKPFTATMAMIAIDRGLVSFDTKVRSAFPHFKGEADLLQLMNHASGLPAWDKFYERYDLMPSPKVAKLQRKKILEEILAKEIVQEPLSSVYSDLGYILLGRWVEDLFSKPLNDIFRAYIAEPLGLKTTGYVKLGYDSPIEAVRTEHDVKRGGDVVGVVHDENCFIQGGVEGHAGLFSNAEDLVTFGEHIRAILDDGKKGIVTHDTISFAISDKARYRDGHYFAGWDSPSGARTSVGSSFSKQDTFGHLGFTGTSLWIDRTKKITVALLSNRVHPTRENKKILPFRIAIHDAVGFDE